MKKNYFFKFILLIIPLSAFILMSNSTGRIAAFNTGSPGDGSTTCTACHGGGTFSGSPSIATNIPVSGYALDTEYTISVMLTSTNSQRAGYQLTAEKTSDNSKAGSFSAGTNAQVFNNNHHVTHTSPINHGGNLVVGVTWKSPSTDQGAIKFYAAINAVNNNGGTTGDNVFTTSSGEVVLGLTKEVQLDFSMYPNPSKDYLTIQLPTGVLNANIQLFDITGRLLKTSKVITSIKQIDVQNLSSGIYILKITSEGKSGAKQFIKN